MGFGEKFLIKRSILRFSLSILIFFWFYFWFGFAWSTFNEWNAWSVSFESSYRDWLALDRMTICWSRGLTFLHPWFRWGVCGQWWTNVDGYVADLWYYSTSWHKHISFFSNLTWVWSSGNFNAPDLFTSWTDDTWDALWWSSKYYWSWGYDPTTMAIAFNVASSIGVNTGVVNTSTWFTWTSTYSNYTYPWHASVPLRAMRVFAPQWQTYNDWSWGLIDFSIDWVVPDLIEYFNGETNSMSYEWSTWFAWYTFQDRLSKIYYGWGNGLNAITITNDTLLTWNISWDDINFMSFWAFTDISILDEVLWGFDDPWNYIHPWNLIIPLNASVWWLWSSSWSTVYKTLVIAKDAVNSQRLLATIYSCRSTSPQVLLDNCNVYFNWYLTVNWDTRVLPFIDKYTVYTGMDESSWCSGKYFSWANPISPYLQSRLLLWVEPTYYRCYTPYVSPWVYWPWVYKVSTTVNFYHTLVWAVIFNDNWDNSTITFSNGTYSFGLSSCADCWNAFNQALPVWDYAYDTWLCYSWYVYSWISLNLKNILSSIDIFWIVPDIDLLRPFQCMIWAFQAWWASDSVWTWSATTLTSYSWSDLLWPTTDSWNSSAFALMFNIILSLPALFIWLKLLL